jgi:hypothetical protein
LQINGLPHLVNALLVTSIFSAGNAYTYCATRSLYGMALEGRAPRFLQYCTKNGVPLYCFIVTMIFPCLSFLQVSSGSAKVLNWLINLITAGEIITYIVMSVTYICFWRACKAQGLDRKSLPYYGRFQPYCAFLGLAWMIMIVTCYGYSSFAPWDVQNFFIYYAMVIVSWTPPPPPPPLDTQVLTPSTPSTDRSNSLPRLETHPPHVLREASRGRSHLGTSHHRRLRSHFHRPSDWYVPPSTTATDGSTISTIATYRANQPPQASGKKCSSWSESAANVAAATDNQTHSPRMRE